MPHFEDEGIFIHPVVICWKLLALDLLGPLGSSSGSPWIWLLPVYLLLSAPWADSCVPCMHSWIVFAMLQTQVGGDCCHGGGVAWLVGWLACIAVITTWMHGANISLYEFLDGNKMSSLIPFTCKCFWCCGLSNLYINIFPWKATCKHSYCSLRY